MDFSKLIVNVVAIFVGLFLYLFLANTKWGKSHEKYQYALMLLSVLAAVAIGTIVKFLIF